MDVWTVVEACARAATVPTKPRSETHGLRLVSVDGCLTIRPAAVSDAVEIARIYQRYVTESAASFEEHPPAPDAIQQRMMSQPRLPWLVGVRSGDVVGYCYACQHRTRPAFRWSADVSIYLDAGERGRGAGRVLYERLLSEVRALGYVSVFAGITLPNEASVRLHESMGFTAVGVFRNVGFKQGRWRNVGWWQRALIDALPTQPAEPQEWNPLD